MDLELKKQQFNAYETGGEITLTQEESAETIVPDYCPDIARIVDTNGKIFIHNRELRDGRAEVTGTVRVSVLYTAEGEGGIRVLEFAMPFTVESDQHHLEGCSIVTAEAETEFLESRMLNPRKLFTHCKLVLHLEGYRRTQMEFCSDVSAEQECCVEKKQEHQHAVFLSQIAEKEFTFAEEMNLSSGREGAAEILRSHVCSTVTETQIVGSKLMFKGILAVSLLYRTAEGACRTASAELPFSQLMELEYAQEGGIPSLKLSLTGCDFLINDGDEGRQIAVTLYLHGTAMIREERDLVLLSDLYSTAYQTSYEASPVQLTDCREALRKNQSVRETLEIGVTAERILALSAECGPVSVSREEDQLSLRTGVLIRAMYQDEGGTPLMAERCVEVSCKLESPENCRITARAICPEEVQGSLSEKGIEVRFQVEFRMDAASRVKKVCILSAELDQEKPKDTTGMPSLVLRRMGERECAWDLAKTYNTNLAAILAANQLEDEAQLTADRLLLLPRKRG